MTVQPGSHYQATWSAVLQGCYYILILLTCPVSVNVFAVTVPKSNSKLISEMVPFNVILSKNPETFKSLESVFILSFLRNPVLTNDVISLRLIMEYFT